ncbi:hypothetical protein OIU84_020303 [Salix udensis]|uniref:Legumain prodomain domain-containing protein n=1 Tax=Salix udensis TaxID=889485 RepID=A0AAD6PG54_9ROSI|nr:hypothetical protein OIU84_020303 [Salix udensis]
MSSRSSRVCGYGTFLFLIALLSSIAQSQEGIVNSTSASNLPSSLAPSSTNLLAMMFMLESPRITLEITVRLTTYLLFSWETKSALTGGSGKVIDSGPNDNIFIYYADHGAPGLVGMPVGKDLYAKDLIEVFEKAAGKLVFYLEACESGTMFEGLLPSNWSIYAITAANGKESSYGVYCPEFYPYPPSEFSTCLGDIFSISWMEDSDLHDTSQETLQQQYEVVRRRTGFDYEETSHVMQYGNMELSKELLSLYIGTNAADDNYSSGNSNNIEEYPSRIPRSAFDQREATLLHFLHKYQRAPDGSAKKAEAHRDLVGIHSHMRHVDRSINHIAAALFGDHDQNDANAMINFARPSGQPLVDDWDCFKELVRAYEKQCGGLSWYGKKYTRVIANMCNAGINVEQMIGASTGACSLPSKDETDRN